MNPRLLQRLIMTIIAACALAAGGCGARVPQVTPELVAAAAQRDATWTEESLVTGRSLYVNRCGSCHSLSAPEAYDEREWHSWVHKMAPKSHLDRRQEMGIVNFLCVAREVVIRAEAQGRPVP